MPQETNFNVSPYFDDFDPKSQYYKVLFKPGYPIQARELTTIQSILQNQIENFGRSKFKDGKVVIPGQLTYENNVHAVEINENFNGVPISLYFDQLVGKQITGFQSGVTADIVAILRNNESERKNYTLYVRYIGSGGVNFTNKVFQDGEILVTNTNILYGSKFVIPSGQGICNAIFTNSTSKGSLVSVQEGVYFVRGIFARVEKQILLLDQYGTQPSYKVGFDIIESVVNADDDETLYDNARNFSNYTAPGADRFKLELKLSKKPLDSLETDNFVELINIVSGVAKFLDDDDVQKEKLAVKNQIARRSYDQTGDYLSKPFEITVRDALNDRILERGLYYNNQSTITGNTPTDDKLIYQISPGKAYINGYEVETSKPTLLECEKARDLNKVVGEVAEYDGGSLFVVNNTFGSPSIGFSGSIVQLRNSRLGSSKAISSGSVIGVARVYDYVPETDYENDSSNFFLRLYDIDTYTKIDLTSPTPLVKPSFFEGKKSNSSGHVLNYPNNSEIDSITFDNLNITSVTFDSDNPNSGIATITTSSPHGYVDGNLVFIDGTTLPAIDYVDKKAYWEVNIPNLEIQSIVFDSRGLTVGIITVTTKEANLIQLNDDISFQNTGRTFLDGISPVNVNTILSPQTFEISISVGSISNFTTVTNAGILTAASGNLTYLTPSQFQIVAPSGTFATLSDVSTGTVVKSTELAKVNSNLHGFSNGEDVFIQNSSNNQFNSKFTVTSSSTNNFRLSTITALNYYNGVTSSLDGTAVAGTSSIVLYGVSGEFVNGEQFSINGIENNRSIKKITDYSLKDVKSINSGNTSSSNSDFRTDVVLNSKSTILSPGTTFLITAASSNNSVITAGLQNNFVGVVSPGDIISYGSTSFSNVVYNEVVSVSAGGTNFTVKPVTSVDGICDGSLPTKNIEVVNIFKLNPYINDEDPSFVCPLNNNVVESISLENNEIYQRREFTNQAFSQGTLQISIDQFEPDIRFATFDEDRYVITYSDGSKENLRSDKVSLSSNRRIATFYNLSFPGGSGTADVITTVVNSKPSSKIKKLNPANVLKINYSNTRSSGIGNTTLNDGLAYSGTYGTRIQDKEICLNVPDVLRVLAVYESYDEYEAKLPSIQANNFTGPSNNNQDIIVGEYITGSQSGASGLVVSKKDTDKLEYVYLNSIQFNKDELVTTNKSNVSFRITFIEKESKNITQNYSLDDGQTDSYYDYSKIVLKDDLSAPIRQIKVVFQNYTIDESDTGEFLTVNSYSQASYKYDIPTFQNQRLSDFIDIRPRVSPYVLSDTCPFEFNARVFENPGQYSKYILAPLEDLTVSYQHYLPRIDKIFLFADGTFECVKGISSQNPVEPEDKSEALDIAVVYQQPYVFNTNNIVINTQDHKGYKMSDISSLEKRIEKLEKFTQLTLLESKIENLKLKDAVTGLDRFKCGYFVDDFSNEDNTDANNPSYRCSIDPVGKTLRPSHFTTSLDLELGAESIQGVASTFNANIDKSFVTDLGNPGVKRTGDLVTLDYSEVLYLEQLKASKSESVTPFLVKFWQGSVTLKPSELRWPAETREINVSVTRRITLDPLPNINTRVVSDVVVNRTVNRRDVIVRAGRANNIWLSGRNGPVRRLRNAGVRVSFQNQTGRWRNNVSAANRNNTPVRLTVQNNRFNSRTARSIRATLAPDVANQFITQINRNRGVRRRGRTTITLSPATSVLRSVVNTTSVVSNSNVTTNIISPETITVNTEVSTSTRQFDEPLEFIRPINISFDVTRLKPLTKFFAYFESIKIDNYITPKLLEIEMIPGTGSFIAGETVRSSSQTTNASIIFALCNPNHLRGPRTNPEETYSLIPFTQTEPPATYTETSSYLNVDTLGLGASQEDEFFGSVVPGMRLVGTVSRAECTVKAPRLISDRTGNLLGSFYVPNPNVPSNPRWNNGQNTLFFTDIASLPQEGVRNESESQADSEMVTAETVPIVENTITSTRIETITPPRLETVTSITNTRTNTSAVTVRRTRPNPPPRPRPRDPLAQTFFVEESEGVFISGVDLYFKNKPLNLPVTIQLRTVTNGYPTNVTLPFGERTLSPDQVNVSINGTVPTRITFPSPVYLKGLPERNIREAPIGSTQLAEYCIVILSDDPTYEVFISELGQRDLLDGNIIAAQTTLGSLFKSQNGTTWTPSQLEDLKYKLYRCDFVPEGIVRFFNPKLNISNRQVTVLGENQIEVLSKKAILKVNGLTSVPSDFKPGCDVIQTPLNSSQVNSKLIGVGGEIIVGSGVSISNAGLGYTNGTFSNINLLTKSGNGSGAIADIVVSGNKISSVNITNGGFSYLPGDTLLIPEIGQNVGFGGEVVVDKLDKYNSLIVDGIDKDFSTLLTDLDIPLQYRNSSGISTFIGQDVKIASTSSVFYDQVYTGLHLKINALNHANHSSSNYVSLREVIPNRQTSTTTLLNSIDQTQNSIINVQSTTGFETFEGVPVSSPSNIGYVLIGDEVVGYTTFTSTTLGGLTRGVDGSQIQTHEVNTEVRKYEFSGVSLRRINIDHTLDLVNKETHPTTLNSFYIKIDPTLNGPSRNTTLYFDKSERTGDSGIVVSNNIQFEALTPNFSVVVPTETSLSSKVRTTSATSVSGSEVSFNDEGFTNISLDGTVFFDTPRLIASPVNESKNISGTPGNKSFTMEFLMKSENSLLSPVLDIERASVVLTSNLVNAPSGIRESSTYADDDFVRTLNADKHSAIYISKPINLKLPANSLKVILSASLSKKNDIRVLYQLNRIDSPTPINFELFPGFKNLALDKQGIKQVVDPSKNDGSEDTEIPSNDGKDFVEYEYSIDDLPQFNGFSIKIVMASTNQADPPLIRDLKAIATVKPQL
jgi:hypothetical protein